MRSPSWRTNIMAMNPLHLPRIPGDDSRPADRDVASADTNGSGPTTAIARIAASALLAVVVATSCGSDDDGDPAGADTASADQTSESTTADDDGTAQAEPASIADPDPVAACLADAGFEMVDDDDLLSEQQRADSLALWGETDSLTFNAATSGFAGGITFFETPAQAQERSEDFAEVASELVVIGNVLITVSAGTGYEAAVAAAKGCL
jgi:hypothetical protein